jgi:aminodeoxyfutalosine synthase
MQTELDKIERKILRGQRLDPQDGLHLFETQDISFLGKLADYVRRLRHGKRVTYILNMHLNYSNICVNMCPICGFARTSTQEGAYQMDLKDVFDQVQAGITRTQITELHIVGSVHPELPYQFYIEMIRGLKQQFPQLHLKAFTAVEIEHLSRISGKGIKDVLLELREAGLGSLPGGGADIFAKGVRKVICPKKTSSEDWLNIHRTAHNLGIPSTATMLYGHIESAQDRLDHMLRLRQLQDETGMFMAFVPLAFQSWCTGIKGPSGILDLKVHAIARLMLDNFEHIKAYWVMTGVKMAELLLHYGANDIDGTIVNERIAHMAGATTPSGITESQLRHLIHRAGYTPVRRDSLYNLLLELNQGTEHKHMGML